MSTSATPQPQSGTLHFSDTDGVRVLSVSGPLTIATLSPFQNAWRGDASPELVFDLTGVPYADSAALGSLVNAYVSRQNSGRKMAVAACERVLKVMEITNVATLFPVFSSLGDAIRALQDARHGD